MKRCRDTCSRELRSVEPTVATGFYRGMRPCYRRGSFMTSLPYELRIGVTGHRTIAEPAAVTRAVDDVLARIAGLLNDPVAPLSLTVVSPLAQGADRLFAKAALAREKIRLEVVTPLPISDYRTDFDT